MTNQNESAVVAQLRDDFENQLRAGNDPVVRDYLVQVRQELRCELVRALLVVELDLLPVVQWRQRLEQHTKELPGYRDELDKFAESGPATIAGNPRPAEGESSRRIGPYKILQVIGEGGMGSVYMVEQESPVKRRAALKVIKSV